MLTKSLVEAAYRQYDRGLITLPELIESLTEIAGRDDVLAEQLAMIEGARARFAARGITV